MIKQDKKNGYALAIIEIANDEKKTKEIYNQAKLIIETIQTNDELVTILDNFSVDFSQKEKMINKIYGKFHWCILNSILLLTKECNFKYVEPILQEVIKTLSIELKIKEGIVYSTKQLSPLKIKALETKLSKDLKTKISLKNYIDKELIGGFKVVIDDYVIESSIRSDIETLKETIIKSRRA